MLRGFDVSHWQGDRAVATALSKVPDAKFVIIKATEGKSYVDPKYQNSYADAVAAGLMTGFYHYARPENGNTPEQEAQHFVRTIQKHVGTSVLVLDYEGTAHKYGWVWAAKWLREVYRLTKVRPLIYLSGSNVKNYTPLADENFGLWIAAWTSEEKMKNYIKGWSFWAMWQYSNSNGSLDLDYFNGSEGQFLMYAAVEESEIEEPGYCGCCDCTCDCHDK